MQFTYPLEARANGHDEEARDRPEVRDSPERGARDARAFAVWRSGGKHSLMSDKRREIDWASAEVHDGKVVVELTGKSSKAWSESFDGVLRLLGHGTGGWEKVALEKKAIEVDGLQPKAAGDLRHFLEAVVVQVNAEVADAPEPEPQAEPADPQELEDQEMTATLRSFAKSRTDGSDAG
jgi:hypothetical protein